MTLPTIYPVTAVHIDVTVVDDLSPLDRERIAAVLNDASSELAMTLRGSRLAARHAELGWAAHPARPKEEGAERAAAILRENPELLRPIWQLNEETGKPIHLELLAALGLQDGDAGMPW